MSRGNTDGFTACSAFTDITNRFYRGLPYQPLGDIYIQIQQTSLKVSANDNRNPKKFF
jgi:hypothetical protein